MMGRKGLFFHNAAGIIPPEDSGQVKRADLDEFKMPEQQLSDGLISIPAVVVQFPVQSVIEGGIGRHEDDQVSFSGQEFSAVFNGQGVVGDVFHHIQGKHSIEGGMETGIVAVECLIGQIQLDNIFNHRLRGEFLPEALAVIGPQVAQGQGYPVSSETRGDIADAAAYFEDPSLDKRPDGFKHPFIQEVCRTKVLQGG